MKPIIKILLFLGWSILLLAGYYYFHKPVDPGQLTQVLICLYDLILSGLILLVCAGLGRKILRFNDANGLAVCSIQAALGAGIFGILWLGFGALGLFHWWSAAAFLLAGLLVLRKDMLAWLRGLSGVLELWKNAGIIGRIFLLSAGLLILNQLWVAFAPPVKYDALTYHLALPRIYLEQGRLVFTPDNPYWGHPQIVEMLYTWAMALGRTSTAAVLSWWAGVLFLIGLAGVTQKYLPKSRAVESQSTAAADTAAAALVFVLVGFTARSMLGWAYTDLFSAWFGLAAIFVFFLWLETGRIRLDALGGGVHGHGGQHQIYRRGYFASHFPWILGDQGRAETTCIDLAAKWADRGVGFPPLGAKKHYRDGKSFFSVLPANSLVQHRTVGCREPAP